MISARIPQLIGAAIDLKERNALTVAQVQEVVSGITERLEAQLKHNVDGFPTKLAGDYDMRIIQRLIEQVSKSDELASFLESYETAKARTKETYDTLWNKFIELIAA